MTSVSGIQRSSLPSCAVPSCDQAQRNSSGRPDGVVHETQPCAVGCDHSVWTHVATRHTPFVYKRLAHTSLQVHSARGTGRRLTANRSHQPRPCDTHNNICPHTQHTTPQTEQKRCHEHGSACCSSSVKTTPDASLACALPLKIS